MGFWQFWHLFPYFIYTTFENKKQKCWLEAKKSVYFFCCKFWIFQVVYPICPSENIPSFEQASAWSTDRGLYLAYQGFLKTSFFCQTLGPDFTLKSHPRPRTPTMTSRVGKNSFLVKFRGNVFVVDKKHFGSAYSFYYLSFFFNIAVFKDMF